MMRCKRQKCLECLVLVVTHTVVKSLIASRVLGRVETADASLQFRQACLTCRKGQPAQLCFTVYAPEMLYNHVL